MLTFYLTSVYCINMINQMTSYLKFCVNILCKGYKIKALLRIGLYIVLIKQIPIPS